ncbi:helix-turn-helix domain-containing protein [Stenotrophomonas sp. GD03680]|uniref:helix-turn-helix domain-containing protein n=1 Tax=Stenotrophomonas sp. GD03680 TaxID=2975365 RepID=UPI002447B5C1|nr:helix-turn-helix domain-containing protein [Stenotrophomonas sp. GD03680]MDH2021236.1 helix-turn-helix domain-containing protein [Stenotrophomonas sp. GD03680]
MSRRSPAYSERIAGVASHTEAIFQFAAWATRRRRAPTIAEIVERWGMSRASACRYRQALIRAGLVQEVN